MELDGWGSISRDLGDMLREQATPSSAKFPAPEQSEEPRASCPGVTVFRVGAKYGADQDAS